MAVDPLADRLEALLAEGSVRHSALTRPMRARLEPLFFAGALANEKSGGGRRTVVSDESVLKAWIAAEYPSGLRGASPSIPERARAVATFRDSKAGDELPTLAVFMRGFGHATLRRHGDHRPIAELTAAHGLAGVLVDARSPWALEGELALVENLEAFLHVERLLPGIDAALWTRGRLHGPVREWIVGMPGVRVVHAPDYDPVGLDEFWKMRRALGAQRARLFVPDHFEDLLQRFGNRELLAKSSAVLERLRSQVTGDARRVLEALDRHGLGLEQEALLIPCECDDSG